MNHLSRQHSHSRRCGALLQLIVFDCPISSNFALPLSPHSRRCHIQQSCRTSHSLSLHLRSILFVPHSNHTLARSRPGIESKSGLPFPFGTAFSLGIPPRSICHITDPPAAILSQYPIR